MKNRPIKVIVAVLLLFLLFIGIAMVAIPALQVKKEEALLQEAIDQWDALRSEEHAAILEGSIVSDEIQPPALVFPELRAAMEAYNLAIYHNGQSDLVDAWSYQTDVFDLNAYGVESGIAGVISIPKINVELPLYLGASYTNLAKGFSQLSQTSMPIGGTGTNCVVACHRGWRGMAYMRDVELLAEGDSVFVQNLWETLEYRVKEAFIIKPHELENIYVQPDRDLFTIVTCHPYRVGSHRYLLVCERYQPEETVISEETVLSNSEETDLAQAESKISITTSDGSSFQPSQPTIFWQTYAPWLFLLAITGLFIIMLLIALLRASAQRKRWKPRYLRARQNADTDRTKGAEGENL